MNERIACPPGDCYDGSTATASLDICDLLFCGTIGGFSDRAQEDVATDFVDMGISYGDLYGTWDRVFEPVWGDLSDS